MVIEPNGRAKKRTRVDCGSTLDLCRESRSPPWGTAAPGWIVAASPGHPSGTGRRPAGSARFRAGRDFFSAESARFVPGGIFSQPGRRGSRREGFFLSRVVAISCREGFFLSRVVAISRREGFFLSRVVAISRRVGSFLSRVVTISRRVGSFLSRVVAVRAGWDRFSAGSSRFRAGWSLAQPGRRGPRRVVSRSAGSSRSAPGGLSLSRVGAVAPGGRASSEPTGACTSPNSASATRTSSTRTCSARPTSHDPLAAADRGVRRRPRAGAPDRAAPHPGVLDAGGEGAPRFRGEEAVVGGARARGRRELTPRRAHPHQYETLQRISSSAERGTTWEKL